ncbi:MAG: hypothetical protein IJB96_03780 [Lachnospira sp.]|nr:hypothetical protein [Lachnospira sp.]
MISSAYSYYLSQYGPRPNAKYDTHTRSQLKNSYSRVMRSNSQTPTYKIDISEAAQRYAIDLKEHARALGYIVRDLSDEQSGEMTFKKSAQSTNPEAVQVTYIGENSLDTASYDIGVTQLAGPQINTGNFLHPTSKMLRPGTHTFDLNINNLTYQFEFNVSETETTKDIQEKISRLINRSNIGLSAEIITDKLDNTAITIKSDATGISGIKPTIFNIVEDDNDLVSTLGLDRVSEYPSNTIYTVNGEEHSATGNEFTINSTFAVKVKDVTGETPVTISMSADKDAMADSISELIGGYNNLFGVTTNENHVRFEGNDRLKKEFTRIAMAHRRTLNNNGLKVEDNGTVSVDREAIMEAADNGKLPNIFSELNDFKLAMQRKAEDIATNPMNYVNNKIVAYKNPHHINMSSIFIG